MLAIKEHFTPPEKSIFRKTIHLSEQGDIEWLNETRIPFYAKLEFDFYMHLYKILTKKYEERKNNLSSILFKK